MKIRNLQKELSNCKHPNSRKTKALVKKAKKATSRQESQNVKWTVLAAKMQWFLDNIDHNCDKYTPTQAKQLIESYLDRFQEELQQILIKHCVGNRKSRQHANREDVIKMTIKREKEEYNTCGLEIPNIMNATDFQLFKQWNGNIVLLQNIKLIRMSKL